MGMYNYLNGEQVKCFSVPIVYIGKEYLTDNEVGHVCLSSMGGLLLDYNEGDEVPYRTSTYNFGKDFIVFDYRGFEDMYTIHFIKNGKVNDYYDFDTLPETFPLLLVIDNYGNPLNIKSRNDFYEIVKDYKNYIEDQYYSELIKIRPLFEDYINSLRKKEPKEELKVEYESQLTELRKRTFDVFREKWCLYDKNIISNNIGWIVDTLVNNTKSEEEKGSILEMYKQESKDFDREVEEYKEWAKDLYSSEEIDIILKISR